MAKRSDCSASKDTDAKAIAGCDQDAGNEHILVETPQETRDAIARIKGHFIDIEKKIILEKKRKNPNAVALGRLGGLKSGKVRRARSALAAKKREQPRDLPASSASKTSI